MEIHARRVQMKIAQLLHDIGCADKPTTHEEGDPESCLDWPSYVIQAAGFIGKLAPVISMEMFPAVRADERDKIAYHITAELVCCDLYDKVEAAYEAMDYGQAQRLSPPAVAKSLGLNWHGICYYGRWAVHLAKEGPEGDRRHEGWWEENYGEVGHDVP
jgi:hypothetical protein